MYDIDKVMKLLLKSKQMFISVVYLKEIYGYANYLLKKRPFLKKEYLIIGEGRKSQFGKEKQEDAKNLKLCDSLFLLF